MAFSGLAGRTLRLLACLAAPVAVQSCVEITGVSGGGVTWASPISTVEGVLTNTDKTYQLNGIPSWLLGGTYVQSNAWPGKPGDSFMSTWDMTISYTAGAYLVVWIDPSFDSGLSAKLQEDGWTSHDRDQMYRSHLSVANAMEVWGKRFDSGSSVTYSGLGCNCASPTNQNTLFVGGVMSACVATTTLTETSTTITTTETTETLTTTQTETTTSVTATATTVTETATSAVATTSTPEAVEDTTTTVEAEVTTTTAEAEVTTTTVDELSTETTTTVRYEVAIFSGALDLTVNNPARLQQVYESNDQVKQALKDGIAAALPGVDSSMVVLLGVRLSRRLGASRQLSGVVSVDYELRVPAATAAAQSLTAASIAATEADLSTHVTQSLQTTDPSIRVQGVRVPEPTLETHWSDDLPARTTVTTTAAVRPTPAVAGEAVVAKAEGGIPMLVLAVGVPVVALVWMLLCAVTAFRRWGHGKLQPNAKQTEFEQCEAPEVNAVLDNQAVESNGAPVEGTISKGEEAPAETLWPMDMPPPTPKREDSMLSDIPDKLSMQSVCV